MRNRCIDHAFDAKFRSDSSSNLERVQIFARPASSEIVLIVPTWNTSDALNIHTSFSLTQTKNMEFSGCAFRYIGIKVRRTLFYLTTTDDGARQGRMRYE